MAQYGSIVYATLRSKGEPAYLPWLLEETPIGKTETTKEIFRTLNKIAGSQSNSWEDLGIRGGLYLWKTNKDVCERLDGKKDFPIDLTQNKDIEFLLMSAGSKEAHDAIGYQRTLNSLNELAKKVDSFRLECVNIEQRGRDAGTIESATINSLATIGVSLAISVLVGLEIIKQLNRKRK